MAKVTCITMQRDEDLLIENWIKHYGNLFGFDRLIVLDNGSQSPHVLDVLNRYMKVGVRVFFGDRKVEDFHEKGNIVCRLIRELEDRGDDSDFYFPIDCDEFLALYLDDDLTCGRRVINDYLDSLLGTRAALRINSSLYNVPNQRGWFCPRHYDKGFVERNTILELDHGFHYPKTTRSDRVLITDLAYLHLHNKPLELLRENARTKLAGFVNPDDAEALRNFNGAGVHLKKYFMMTDKEYENIYETMMQIFVPSLRDMSAALE